MALSVISLNFMDKITLFSPFLVVSEKGGLVRLGLLLG
jgi:hypothetical protein